MTHGRSFNVCTFVLITASLGCSDDLEDREPARGEFEVVAAELVIRIGDQEQETAPQFGRVRAVSFDGADEVAVLDVMAQQVIYINLGGAVIGSVGRRGQGPGEFTGATGLAVQADTTFVFDTDVWRITPIVSGTALETISVEPRPMAGWPAIVTRATDGRWLYVEQNISPGRPPKPIGSVVRATAEVWAWNTANEQWIRIASVPGQEAAVTAGFRGEAGLSEAPFPARPLIAAGSNGSFWHVDSRGGPLRRLSASGDVITSIVLSEEGRLITPADMNSYTDGAAGRPNSDELRAQRRAITAPHRHPLLMKIVGDKVEGGVWIGYESVQNDVRRWEGYDIDGTKRYRLDLPANFNLHEVRGDMLLGVSRDELEVQRIDVFRLARKT